MPESEEPGLVKVPSFFRHPLEYLRKRNLRDLQENSRTQEEFFIGLVGLIYASKNDILSDLLIKGYDFPFMESQRTLDAIRKTDSPTRFVCAIVSEKDNYSSLERLAKEKSNIHLIVVPEEIKKGYIVYGDTAVSWWDSNKLTYHPAESQKGVIYRSLWIDDCFSSEAGRSSKEFERYKNEVLTRKVMQ